MLPKALKSCPKANKLPNLVTLVIYSGSFLNIYEVEDQFHVVDKETTNYVTYLDSLFLKIGQNPASFCIFSFFSHDTYCRNIINDKSVDGVLGTQTRGGRMVGADESTELWRHPSFKVTQV